MNWRYFWRKKKHVGPPKDKFGNSYAFQLVSQVLEYTASYNVDIEIAHRKTIGANISIFLSIEECKKLSRETIFGYYEIVRKYGPLSERYKSDSK